jgi:Ring finger domain
MESLLLRSFFVSPVFNQLAPFRQLSYLLVAKNYMTEVFQCKVEPSLSACRQFCEFQIQFSRKPMLREFIQFVYRPCGANCEYVTPVDQSIPIMEHLFVEYGIISNCQLVYFCYTYLQFEQRYPTNEELTHYIDTAINPFFIQDDSAITQWMNQDVEEYWNRKRSTVDVSKLPREIASEEKSPCCICQEAIENGQVLIRLPCSHVFHSELDSECSGIEPWLQKSDSCPLCKKSVLIQTTKEKREEEFFEPEIQPETSDNEDEEDTESSEAESEEDSIYVYSNVVQEQSQEESQSSDESEPDES